jgi:GT2 family glycosyltransferase
MNEKVLALVVTHNRKPLLAECLDSLASQVRPPDHILVVDNASTDDTPALLAQRQVEHLRLKTNTGAAGGFHTGLAEACRRDFDWAWLLDDDAHPHPDSLLKLLTGLQQARTIGPEPSLLLSRLLWLDGRTHPMGIPWPDIRRPGLFFKAHPLGLLPVRFGTYASMLVNLHVARKYPLPTTAYFLYNDDLEYSGRLLRRGVGYLVKDSLTVHKTRNPYSSTITASDEIFFLEARNRAWLICSDAFGPLGKTFWLLNSLGVFLARLCKRGLQGCTPIWRGWLEGFRTFPGSKNEAQ